MTSIVDRPSEAAALFASDSVFGAFFEQRLGAILEQEGNAGALILVLANAVSEPGLLDRLRSPLQARFDDWFSRLDRGDPIVDALPADDLAVLRRLREFGGPAMLEPVRRRLAGPWELQFNPLRALRPARMSASPVVPGAVPDFDPAGFHFHQPYLHCEILWEGVLDQVPVRLLYNKFPFAERHGLLVPEPAAGRPQRLDLATHRLAWRICERFGPALPGIGLGYNAYGANASVNHLHLQLFVRSGGRYPIESTEWRHNGGSAEYPLPVVRCEDVGVAWSLLSSTHATGTAYNLIYRPQAMYLVPRAPQGVRAAVAWDGGFAWAELGGSVSLGDTVVYAELHADEVAAAMRRLALSG